MHNNGRRRFIMGAASLTTLALINSRSLLAAQSPAERRLKIHNVHTGDTLDVVYWRDGRYLETSLDALNNLMRDHHCDQVTRIDPPLFDLMYNLYELADAKRHIELYSGYRSAQTNQALREKSERVAKNSLHIQGKAADIRLAGVRLDHAGKAALSMKSGGVGYYHQSGFLHLDTGRVRQWGFS